jgi:hypothetical protein
MNRTASRHDLLERSVRPWLVSRTSIYSSPRLPPPLSRTIPYVISTAHDRPSHTEHLEAHQALWSLKLLLSLSPTPLSSSSRAATFQTMTHAAPANELSGHVGHLFVPLPSPLSLHPSTTEDHSVHDRTAGASLEPDALALLLLLRCAPIGGAGRMGVSRTPEQQSTLTTFRQNLVHANLCPVDPLDPQVIANGPGYVFFSSLLAPSALPLRHTSGLEGRGKRCELGLADLR